MTQYSTTRITTRGYDVTMPTAAVQGFLSLSHDDQVELAEQLNALEANRNQFDLDLDLDEDEISANGNVISDLIEGMAHDLDVQDQAIDAFMEERADLIAITDMQGKIIADQRREIAFLVDASNAVLGIADQTIDAFMAEREELKASNDQGYAVLVQAANYMTDVRRLVGQLGIEIGTDETGSPVLNVDTSILSDAIMMIGAVERV